jgi:hypothetical protein
LYIDRRFGDIDDLGVSQHFAGNLDRDFINLRQALRGKRIKEGLDVRV